MDPTAPRIKLVLFDFDGTLVDSQHAIVEAMGMAFAGADLTRPPSSAVRRVVGLSLETAVAKLMVEMGKSDIDMAQVMQVADRYRQAHAVIRARPEHPEPLFPGVEEVLSALDSPDRFLGIATGKSMAGLCDCLDRHGLAHRFATLQTGDRNRSKPDPEMVHRAMDMVGVDPEETIVIGDTTFDMTMAGNAGVTGLGVEWGYHEPGELLAAGAALVLSAPGELMQWISSRDRVNS